jgi:hypothetical protein
LLLGIMPEQFQAGNDAGLFRVEGKIKEMQA